MSADGNNLLAPDLPPAPLPGRLREATRAQRIALLVGLLVVFWFALQLFASILLPFVAAAGIAYFLDPVATRLVRAGIPRTPAALLLIVALIAACLLFALLLYPLILAQINILLARLPGYIQDVRAVSPSSPSPICRSGWGRSSSIRSCATWWAARPGRCWRSWPAR